MNSSWYFLSLILILAASSSHCESSDNKLEDVETPFDQVDIGPFRIEASMNDTTQKERLKLRKSYIKVKLSDKHHPDVTYGSIKFSTREELLMCDQLTLESTEQQDSLDCQPLESFFSNNKTKSDGIKFVRRTQIRFKPRLPKFIPQVQQEYRLFPIVKGEVEGSIKRVYEEHNLTELGFVENNIKFGYYYEAYLKQQRDQVDPLVCTGKVFISINQTDQMLPSIYINESYLDSIEAKNYLVEQAWENGYLLTFENVSCYKSGFTSIISLSGSFTIIQRMIFPYLTVRHTMTVSPIKEIFNYDAHVNQTLEPEKGPSAYNTSIQISSNSALFDLMNFHLNQVFANEDLEKGMEKMSLITRAGFGFVKSHWDGEEFIKIFRWFNLPALKDIVSLDLGFMETIPDNLQLIFKNTKADDYLQLLIKLKKDVINPLLETVNQVRDEL